jgi:hypothetical protein
VGLPGGDHAAADGEGGHALLAQVSDEIVRGGRAQQLGLARGGVVHQGAVFGDHEIADRDPRKDLQEVVEPAPGGKDEPPPARLQPLQGGERARGDDAFVRQGAVVVGGENVITQRRDPPIKAYATERSGGRFEAKLVP